MSQVYLAKTKKQTNKLILENRIYSYTASWKAKSNNEADRISPTYDMDDLLNEVKWSEKLFRFPWATVPPSSNASHSRVTQLSSSSLMLKAYALSSLTFLCLRRKSFAKLKSSTSLASLGSSM